MGLMDIITDAVSSAGRDRSASTGLLEGILDLLKGDGIRGLQEKFDKKGLGDIISSWIGTGENRSIDADSLRDILGSDAIGEIARRAGSTEEDVSKHLKDLLPDIIDRATPKGSIEDDER